MVGDTRQPRASHTGDPETLQAGNPEALGAQFCKAQELPFPGLAGLDPARGFPGCKYHAAAP